MSENIIKVGNSPIAKHIYALLRHTDARLIARGTNIKRCVDIAVIASRDWGYKIDNISIYDTKYKGDDNKERHISNIEIVLSK